MNITTKNWRRKLSCSLALLLLASGGTIRGEAAPATKAPQISWSKSKPGDRGESVRTLQYLLRARSYKVNTDGVFGVTTKSAVIKFQRSHGLVADGIVGGQTWKALVITVKRGSKGDAVRALQNQLKTLDLGKEVSVDGNFGQKTESAVKNLQNAYDQKKDGIVGLKTWGALFEEGEGDY